MVVRVDHHPESFLSKHGWHDSTMTKSLRLCQRDKDRQPASDRFRRRFCWFNRHGRSLRVAWDSGSITMNPIFVWFEHDFRGQECKMPQRKVRGKRRNCRSFARRMSEFTAEFPPPDVPAGDYWHLHLPVAQGFVDSPRTPQRVRRHCVQVLLDSCSRLISLRPCSVNARVVAAVATPSLFFNSQLIVFFSQQYFTSFFHRDEPEQRWTALPASRSLTREWGLSLPLGCVEWGFHEHIQDGDDVHHGEIWFVGELT